MGKIRCLYSKTSTAKYISHLDLMSDLKRSLLRAGVKLEYSQGFNPHPYISVALPLSVGCESECELVDIGFSGGFFPKDINKYLPQGLIIHEVYAPERKFALIKWIKVSFMLGYENTSSDELKEIAENINQLLSKESLIISKKTKRDIKDIDIAPAVKCDTVAVKSNSNIEIIAYISAQNPTVSQNDIISVLVLNEKMKKPIEFLLKRIDVYDQSMIRFR